MVKESFQAGFSSNSGHYLQTQKEKRQTCCCSQSHSCGQGKRELRECLLDLQWKVNEERSWAKLFLFLTSQQQWPFFPFCGESIRMDGRRRRGDLYRREELWWKLAMSTLPFTGSPHSCKFELFLGHQRIYWKRTCVMQQVLWDFFYINSRFGLLCNLWYSDCFTNWDKNWRVSLKSMVETLLCLTMATVTSLCDLERMQLLCPYTI